MFNKILLVNQFLLILFSQLQGHHQEAHETEHPEENLDIQTADDSGKYYKIKSIQAVKYRFKFGEYVAVIHQ